MKKPVILLGLATALSAGLLASPAHAETEPADVGTVQDLISDRIDEVLHDNEIPGAAAALIVDGAPVLTEGYGLARTEGDIPFNADTAYYTASLGKLFTTATALQLVGQDELDLDADVNDHLASFEVPDAYPGRPVTLRHLLTHTSGFEDRIYGWSQWETDEMPSLEDFSAEQLPDRVRPPGSLVSYNNYDMVLAGLLIEEATGLPFEEALAERLFAPLGMEDTRIVFAEPSTGAAEGYRVADGLVPTTGRLSPGTPAGPGMLTTAEDMSRFMTALLESDPALGEGVAEQMTSRQFSVDDRMPGMGYSLQEFEAAGLGVWFKGGDLPGFHSALVLAPEHGVAFHVVFNGDGTDAAAVSHAAAALAGDVLDALEVTAPQATPEAVPEDLERYTGEYASTRITRSDFTEVVRVFSPVTVEAAEDGMLHTTGLSYDPDGAGRYWVPVGDGLFRERDGRATLAFTADGTLLTSEDPTIAYEPVPWYDSAALHLIALGAGALILAAGFVALTVAAVARLIRRSPRRPVLHTAGAVSLWLLGGAALAIGTLLALATADSNLMVERIVAASGLLEATLVLSLAAVALTAVSAVVYAAAAIRREWKARVAVGHGLMVAGGLLFSFVLLSLNLAAI